MFTSEAGEQTTIYVERWMVINVIHELVWSWMCPVQFYNPVSSVWSLQDDKDLVPEFVASEGLTCFIKVGAEADHNYQNYILRGETPPRWSESWGYTLIIKGMLRPKSFSIHTELQFTRLVAVKFLWFCLVTKAVGGFDSYQLQWSGYHHRNRHRFCLCPHIPCRDKEVNIRPLVAVTAMKHYSPGSWPSALSKFNCTDFPPQCVSRC